MRKGPLSLLLEISTGHVSRETMLWLDALNWEVDGPAGGKVSYGWLIYAHDDNLCFPSPPHAPDGEFPPELWNCFVKARELGAGYIRFDCDIEPDEDLLPVFDHNPPGDAIPDSPSPVRRIDPSATCC